MTEFAKRSSLPRTLITACIILVFIALRLFEIDEPWIGIHDFQGALFSLISRNIEHYGFLNTSFGPVMSRTGDQFYYYLHHPHLLWVAGAFLCRVLGDHEWTYRLLSISFSAGSLILLYVLVRRLWERNHAIAAMFFYALSPMDAYYSRGYSCETAVSFFLLLMVLLYLKLLDTNRNKYYFLILLVFLFAGSIGWPTYYILPVFALHYRLYRGPGKESRLKASFFLLAGILLFLLFVLYTKFLTGSWMKSGLVEGFVNRSGIPFGEVGKKSYSVLSFLLVEGKRSIRLFTPLPILLTLVWFYDALKAFRSGIRDNTAHYTLLFFTLVASIHVILFLDGAWRHEFWLYYFVIPISMASAYATMKLYNFLERIRPTLSSAFLILLILTFGIGSVRATMKQYRLTEGESIYHLSLRLRSDAVPGKGTIFYLKQAQPLMSRYYHYYGEHVLNKPSSRVAYYLNEKVLWGVRDLDDLMNMIKTGKFTRLVTSDSFYQNTMDASIKAWLDENCRESKYHEYRIYYIGDNTR